MAPRRGVRSVKTVNIVNYSNITLSDVLCPICRCILIQPVTLPCNHDFCLSCFDGTLANANLTCPLCRVRFSSWHRIAKKDNKIINVKLWEIVKNKFPRQVQNRLQGIEERLEEETPIKLTTPGEIRKEYEAQKRKQELELQKQMQAEETASKELIRKLKEQEEYEETIREEKLRLDEQVARKIAEDLGYDIKPTVSKIVDISKNRRPLDKFIKNYKSNNSMNESATQKMPNLYAKIHKEKNNKQKNLMNFSIEISDSNDSIENECRYFKPIDHRNIPPSKCGTALRIPAVIKKATTIIIGAPAGNINFSHGCNISAFARFEITSPILKTTAVKTPTKFIRSRKRKYSENYTIKPSILPAKRRTGKDDESSKITKQPPKMILRDRKMSGSPFLGFDSEDMKPLIRINGTQSLRNVEYDEQKEQEKKDLEYAKKLQEEFNKERYSTRSSIICRNNVKKTKQVTLKQIMSTSKCK